MALSEQPEYRKAVLEARARVHKDVATQARARRRYLSILFGFGLSFVLLGGVTGGYLALDRVSASLAGASVALPVPGPVAHPVAQKLP